MKFSSLFRESRAVEVVFFVVVCFCLLLDPPSVISLVVSVDVKHHVYLLLPSVWCVIHTAARGVGCLIQTAAGGVGCL